MPTAFMRASTASAASRGSMKHGQAPACIKPKNMATDSGERPAMMPTSSPRPVFHSQAAAATASIDAPSAAYDTSPKEPARGDASGGCVPGNGAPDQLAQRASPTRRAHRSATFASRSNWPAGSSDLSASISRAVGGGVGFAPPAST
jgi:hypothetical protein